MGALLLGLVDILVPFRGHLHGTDFSRTNASRIRRLRFLVPSFANFLWFAVFGGTAIHMELRGGLEIAARVQDDVAMSLHLLLAVGLNALRTASVSAGLPQSVLLIPASFALYRTLRHVHASGGVVETEQLKRPVSKGE